MIYVATLIFPIVSIVCGIAVVVSLTRFIKDIRRDARAGRDEHAS